MSEFNAETEWTPEKLAELPDDQLKALLDDTCRTCYRNLEELGVVAMGNLEPETSFKVLVNMINYFERIEEFEKCANLVKWKEKLHG